ncbi:MAG: endonuclease NucS domain-containing protein [Gammaproteobacteria bacterium]
MKEQFKAWLVQQGKTENTANNYASCVNSVGGDYSQKTGKTVAIYEIEDVALVSEIARQYGKGGDYSQDGDKSAGGWRAGIARYAEFVAETLVKDGDGDSSENHSSETEAADVASVNFGYERDLQTVFCAHIAALYPGYKIIGREHPIENKRIDVLLEHADNKELLVVELKAGQTDARVFGQISMYIGMLQKQPGLSGRKIKGVIIAGAIDDGLLYACKTNPDISVKTYRRSIELENSCLPDSEGAED